MGDAWVFLMKPCNSTMVLPDTVKNTRAIRPPVKLLRTSYKPGIVRQRCAERRAARPAEFNLHQIATDQYMVLLGETPDPVEYRLSAACQLEE